MAKLSRSFYEDGDVVSVSKRLLGKVLCTRINGKLTSGMIVETEAYNGRNDKACHAHQKRTGRTEIMYGPPGFAYVYLCYGIHHLFNIVTNRDGLADAVLIRAIEPKDGVEIMMARRGKSKLQPSVGAGPGILSQALGITTDLNGVDLHGETIWVEDRGIEIPDEEIKSTPRIGVDYAGEDARLPWRFIIQNSEWTSR